MLILWIRLLWKNVIWLDMLWVKWILWVIRIMVMFFLVSRCMVFSILLINCGLSVEVVLLNSM